MASTAPREVIALIIRRALDAPTRFYEPATTHLLAFALVSKAWAEEAQRVLFAQESSVKTRSQIESWLLAAPRFPVHKLSVSRPDYYRKGDEDPTLEDVGRMLEALGDQEVTVLVELHLGQVAGLTCDVLRHASLAGLKKVSLALEDFDQYEDLDENDPPTTNPPVPDATPFAFSLSSLVLSTSLYYPSIQPLSLDLLEPLVPAVSSATSLSFHNFLSSPSGFFDGDLTTSHLAARFLHSASSTLEILHLELDGSELLHAALSSCRVLKEFTDGTMGDRHGVVVPGHRTAHGLDPRILALPDSVEVYGTQGNDHEDNGALYEAFAEVLLNGDGVLPNLREVGCGWLLEDGRGVGQVEFDEVWERVKARRPGLKFV